MKIVMTGASGFLGSHLIKGLIAAGHEVVAAVRGSSNLARIKDLLDSIQLVDLDQEGVEGLFRMPAIPEAVIHTATSYGREGTGVDEIYESNVRFPVKLINSATRHGIRLLINTDTYYPAEYPLLPDYARSKKQFADWGRAHAGSEGYQFMNLRLEHLYGPGDGDGKFIPFLIKSCLEDQAEIPLTGGKQKRDFIYVSDVVDAYLKILEKAGGMLDGYHQFGVGTGRSISIRDLAELIREASGSSSTFLFGAVPLPDGELLDSKADTKEIENLGWYPKVSLKEGITRTVRYYSTHDESKSV